MHSPLSFGMVGARPVFMDERDDSYFVLQPAHETAFLECVQEKSRIPRSLCGALGLSGEEDWPLRACASRCTSSLLEQLPMQGGSRPVDLLRVACALRWARRMVKTRSMLALLGSVKMLAHATTAAEAGLIERALSFLAARRYLPSKPNCLIDSLALIRFLGTLAAGAELTFGVKLEPFAAHCWVQSESLLLNDRTDYVDRFAPVRIVKCLAATR